MERISSTIPQLVGILGAVLAAFVGFMSFWFNYRATLRNQRDTQFFEALKRFGDEHAATRTSAAGLLAQMAETGATRWWRNFDYRLPYFSTTLNQLAAGLALETDPVVAAAIGDSLKRLASLEPHRVLAAVKPFHFNALRLLIDCLATYCAIEQERGMSSVDALRIAATASPYDDSILRRLIERPLLSERRTATISRVIPFAVAYANAERDLQLTQGADRFNLRKETLRTITITSERLRETADIIVSTCRLARPTIATKPRGSSSAHSRRDFSVPTKDLGLYLPLDLDGTFLIDADFTFKDLELITFGSAQLDGADFSGSHLTTIPIGTRFDPDRFNDTIIDEPDTESEEAVLAAAYGLARSQARGFKRVSLIALTALAMFATADFAFAFGTRIVKAVSLVVLCVGIVLLFYSLQRLMVRPLKESAFWLLFSGGVMWGGAALFTIPLFDAGRQFAPFKLMVPTLVIVGVVMIIFGVVQMIQQARKMRYY